VIDENTIVAAGVGAGTGIDLTNSLDAVVAANTIKWWDIGLRSFGDESTVILGNVVDAGSIPGPHAAITLETGHDINVLDNVLKGAPLFGLALTGVQGALVANNAFCVDIASSTTEARDDGWTDNQWSLADDADAAPFGTNIVGGGQLGGNWWSSIKAGTPTGPLNNFFEGVHEVTPTQPVDRLRARPEHPSTLRARQ
jgi:hypothetical protein